VRRRGDAGCAAAGNAPAIRGRQTTSTPATQTRNFAPRIVRATLLVQIVAGQNDGGFYRGGYPAIIPREIHRQVLWMNYSG